MSVLLAGCMILMMLPVFAFAAGNRVPTQWNRYLEEYAEGNTQGDPSGQIVISSATARSGDTLTLEIRLENNPGLAGLWISLQYDASVFTLLSVENGEALAHMTTGRNIIWDNDDDYLEDGLLCKLVFQVAENAPAGSYEISAVLFDASNKALKPVSFTVVAGQVQVVDIQYGDVNGDTKVDGRDVIQLRKYMANYDYDTGTSTEAVSAGADVNGDGVINGQDVVLLRRYMANYDYETGASTVVLGPQ